MASLTDHEVFEAALELAKQLLLQQSIAGLLLEHHVVGLITKVAQGKVVVALKLVEDATDELHALLVHGVVREVVVEDEVDCLSLDKASGKV